MKKKSDFEYFWISGIQGTQHKCYTQSGSKKEYDGTLEAKQRYVIFTEESTTNGEHIYRISNNGSFNGDNGDYSKWEALSTYTLPTEAIKGTDFEHIVYGNANVLLSDYHGVRVYGTPQVIYRWSINKNITIQLNLSYKFQNGMGYVFTLEHPVYYDSNNKMINFTYSVKVNLYKSGGIKIKEITISITTSNGIGSTASSYHDYSNCTAGLQPETATCSPKSGTLQNGGKFIVQYPRGFT